MADQAAYCITCKTPDQTYRCQVTGDDLRSSDALKLYCIIRTAKEGNHASCSAARSVTACNDGLVKVYNYEGPAIPPEVASDPRVRQLLDQAGQDQSAATRKDNAPKTMFELGGRAVSASRQGFRRARSALGGSPAEDAGPVPLTPQSPPPPLTETSAATGSIPEPDASKPSAVRKAAQNASAAVGGFARKSYRCVLSFFRDCRGEAAGSQALE
jgi:hypothetical protein